MYQTMIIFLVSFCFLGGFPQEKSSFRELYRFHVPEARQGVAVDEHFFYAVDSRGVAKYEKKTGKKVLSWKESEDGPVIHLDSGVIVDGKLLCAHSNYPGVPMTSSVEIWDCGTLDHIESHSFGIQWGSCTWIDRHNGFWWAAFAHYNKLEAQTRTDNTHTTLIKFNDDWQAMESWVYPESLIERFDGMSNSGGSWGPDGRLYLTGHDRKELYAVSLPGAGSVLVLEEIIQVPNEGQGIAWDHDGILYTIRKSEREVVVLKWIQNMEASEPAIQKDH